MRSVALELLQGFFDHFSSEVQIGDDRSGFGIHVAQNIDDSAFIFEKVLMYVAVHFR